MPTTKYVTRNQLIRCFPTIILDNPLKHIYWDLTQNIFTGKQLGMFSHHSWLCSKNISICDPVSQTSRKSEKIILRYMPKCDSRGTLKFTHFGKFNPPLLYNVLWSQRMCLFETHSRKFPNLQIKPHWSGADFTRGLWYRVTYVQTNNRTHKPKYDTYRCKIPYR